ncbi:UNVERIFIED_CONTAM: hypothetical protein HDU68_001875, partial [Siphonaria sp. JEL0065]
MEAPRQGRETQVYTYEGARKVVGVVPVLPDGRIVMVSSAKRKNEWILPKGGAETDESLEQSALREAYEEAGISGTLRQRLCNFKNEKINPKTGFPSSDFEFWIMDVTKMEAEWPESHLRARETFTPTEALEILLGHRRNSIFIAMQAFIDQKNN